jgi:CRP-like cAMP-binding protein
MARRRSDARLGRVPLFSDLSKRELRAVSRLATPLTVPTGRELIREGEPGREFVVVIAGAAEVRRAGRTLAPIGPGEFFGEIALLFNRRHTATVIARTDMTIAVMTRRGFATMLQDHPRMYEPLLRAAVDRLPNLDGNSEPTLQLRSFAITHASFHR